MLNLIRLNFHLLICFINSQKTISSTHLSYLSYSFLGNNRPCCLSEKPMMSRTQT
uniref:Uncharacterized protein n=1 Tax=Arundo donax TaxID=35708 RepID=A0A0A9BKN3_ARUDO